MVWRCAFLAFLLGLGVAGCMSFHGNASPAVPAPDPFVADIACQPVVNKMEGSALLKPEIVFTVVPLHTPVKEARALMERHGFSCWSAVPDGSRTCLHCTAYHRKRADYMDRIVVKLFYENQRVINAEVRVDYDAHRPVF
jgi:hypothetical protein